MHLHAPAALAPTLLAVGLLTGCQSSGSPTDLSDHLAGLPGVVAVDVALPDPGDDWDPSLSVTVADEITRADLSHAIQESLDGMDELYGRAAREDEIRVLSTDQTRRITLSTADHVAPAVLADAWAATSRALEDLAWELTGRGQVHVASEATPDIGDILALADRVASDDRLGDVPAWLFTTSDLGDPVTVLATDERLTGEVVERWRGLVVADDLLPGRGFEQLELTPQEQPGYRVEDPAGPGAINPSVTLDHDGAGSFTPEQHGDLVGPALDALWSVVEAYGPGSRLHVRLFGDDDSGDLLHLVVDGDPLPAPDHEADAFGAWTSWADQRLDG
ncbi:hypothetical protein [Pimelobacter simplex]|uniref:hypothetical protein n=1 Tax=Nocardioides simplex TaxID=2045 RepID=UPI00193455EB|nr:hypothetical protein [Pimelobacter simplex]